MAGHCWRLLAILSLIFIAPLFLRGQEPAGERVPLLQPNVRMLRYPPSELIRAPLSPNLPRPSPTPGTLAFQKIVIAAGLIFSGRVSSIGQIPGSSGQHGGSTTITFQVERAIRGIAPGQFFTLHEWAGLWATGERYRIGEHVLLFLYPVSNLGLTSPVAGALGRFAVDSRGRILMNGQHTAAWGADPILRGRAVIPYSDFARAMRQVAGQE